MRLKSRLKQPAVLEKICASLNSLNQIAWFRFADTDVQISIIPDGSIQCWSKLQLEPFFDKYICQSAAEGNAINLQVSLHALSRALRSATINATDVWIKLTKKDNVPMLSLTIHTSTYTDVVVKAKPISDEFGDFDVDFDLNDPAFGGAGVDMQQARETIITQDVPVKVLHPADVGGLHEPNLREPDVHIYFPPLLQVKNITDKFLRLAAVTTESNSRKKGPRFELKANMHGSMKIGLKTNAMAITSSWNDLTNPELDSNFVEGGEEAVRDHPTARMRELGGPDGQNEAGWAKVNIESKEFAKVLSVGRVSERIVGCIIDGTALIMYCWVGEEDEESCLTVSLSALPLFTTNLPKYYITSYST